MAAAIPAINPSIEELERHSVDIHSIHSTSKDHEQSSGEAKKVNIETEERGVVAGNVVTRTSTKGSWKDPGPPPDGGTTAWLQVVCGHLVVLNTWGFINSFGVFQTYYVTALKRAPADISWIGSIQVFLLFFVGTISGRLTDAGYFRYVFVTGSLLSCFGLFMTSLSTTYWQIFLAQGVCCGLGNGLCFTPTVSLISTYFSKKRNLAIGLCAAGSSTGGVIFPLMVQQLLPKAGFPWTMRALGFVQMACLSVCCVGLRRRVPPRKTGAIIDVASLKDVPYILFAIGMFFTFLGTYVAFYYIGSFARSIIGLPYAESIDLLVVLNAVGVLGRVLPNYLADRYFGPLNTLIPSVIISSVLVFCWIVVNSRSGLYGWAVFYGLSGACIQGLFPATLSSLTPDLRKAGTRMGQVFTTVSFAVLIGPPIAGVLVQRDGGRYVYAQIFGGTTLLVGFMFLVTSRMVRSKGALWAKM